MSITDPTLGLTFLDLQCRVAEYLGTYSLTGGVVAPPTNAYELDSVNRLVNDGYRRFIAENPRWNFLTVPFSITFAGTPISGQVVTGGANTFTDGSLAGLYTDNQLVGYQGTLTHIDSALDEFVVTANVGATGQITVAANFIETPAAGESYQMLPQLQQSPAIFGQTWRYSMPGDFMGICVKPFTFNLPSPRVILMLTDETQIRSLYSTATSSGIPSYYAFRPLNTNASTTGSRWEMLLWPMPGQIATITSTYKRYPQKLVNAGDRSICGFQHDDALIKACIAEAERQRNDGTSQVREGAYQTALAAAKAEDARSNPQRETDYGDRSDGRLTGKGILPSSYYDINSYNGVRVP